MSNKGEVITQTGILYEEDVMPEKRDTPVPSHLEEYKIKIYWFNVATLTYLHLSAAYGLYLTFTSAKFATILFSYILLVIAGLGELAGAHRLWSHRAYKANLGLRIFLMLCNCVAYEDSIYNWVRNHRVHHKFSDTDADPHNRKRGLFFCHIGWIMVRKHPLVAEKGKGIDLSDLHQDPVVMFQKKYRDQLIAIFCFLLPTVIPMWLWSESCNNAYHVATMLRLVIHSNCIWLINSAAHSFGNRPYDRNIMPSENWAVTVATLGEGWHNYHHTFPWDYRAAELGNFRFNFTTWFIDFCAKMGWAWDLKSVKPSMIEQRVKRTGDGTYGQSVWGWGDSDMCQEDKEEIIYNEVLQKTS